MTTDVLSTSGFEFELSLPIRGLLLQKGKLRGIYVDGGIIPVTEELPKEVHRAVIKGRYGRSVTVREFQSSLEVLLEVDYRSWPVFFAKIL